MLALTSIKDLLARASAAEAENDWPGAIACYEQVLRLDDLHELAYDRLMVLHRRQKQYKKEMAVIDKGLRAFSRHYGSLRKKSKASRRLAELSQALMRSTGLTDKKGHALYDPEPLARWKKRKETLAKKLG